MAPVITVTTETVVDSQIPTLTHYVEMAADLMGAIDVFGAIIPKLDESETADAQQVRKNLNVPDVFCFTTINAAEQLPELETSKKLFADKNRNRLQYLEAFRPLKDKVDALSRRLKHGLRANKSALATDSLEIYRVAQALAKDTRNPALTAQVAAMKRDLAKKAATKAQRDARKAAKLNEAVEREIQKRRIQAALADQRQKEVKNA